jgi:hypothetical protein
MAVPKMFLAVAQLMLRPRIGEKGKRVLILKKSLPYRMMPTDWCFIPALFVAGEDDNFIQKHHSEQIHEKYAGDKRT